MPVFFLTFYGLLWKFYLLSLEGTIGFHLMSLEGKTLALFCGLGSEILCEFPVSLGQKTTRDWDIGWTKEEASSESSRLHLKIYLYPLWRPPSLPHSDAFLQENVVSKYSSWTFSSEKVGKPQSLPKSLSKSFLKLLQQISLC